MTTTDRKILSLGGLLTLIVTLSTILAVKPDWETVVAVLAPIGVIQITSATMLVAALSAGLAVAYYGGGELDTPHTTWYYVFQSPLEEIIFRFNAVLAAKTLEFSPMEVIALGFIQALIFMVLHFRQNPKKVVKHLALGVIWFAGAYYAGIIPAMVGHIVHQLALRAKIRNDQGWLYEKED